MTARGRVDAAAQAGLDAAVTAAASPAVAAAARPVTRRVSRLWPWLLLPFAVFTMLVLMPLLTITTAMGGDEAEQADPTAIGTTTCDGAVQAVQGLTEDQTRNAAIIVKIAGDTETGVDGAVVGIITAMQESTLINIDGGDRDSLGLFQQRPSTGWGTPEQILDPVLATQAFYGVAAHTNNPGLVDIDGWQDMAPTEAAQAVQRSAFPTAYARWVPMARALVGIITDRDIDPCPDVPTTGNGELVNPVAGDYVITSPHGGRYNPVTGQWHVHSGVDLASPMGTPIVAAMAGTVAPNLAGTTYGNVIIIDHPDDLQTRYAHLSAMHVPPGRQVAAGQHIGDMGSTGNSTGSHLHFEVRVGGTPVNPEPWMAQRGVPL